MVRRRTISGDDLIALRGDDENRPSWVQTSIAEEEERIRRFKILEAETLDSLKVEGMRAAALSSGQ